MNGYGNEYREGRTARFGGPLVGLAIAAGLLAAAGTPATARAQDAPEWMEIDHEAREVVLRIVAGETEVNNRWNFNGYAKGNATITVPRGYEVTIEFRNGDPAVPHSLGIDEMEEKYPPIFEDPTPAFEGAISANPTSLTESAMPGEVETISFMASRAGEYVMLCYVPVHAATGMWIGFAVSADGEAGFSTEGS